MKIEYYKIIRNICSTCSRSSSSRRM